MQTRRCFLATFALLVPGSITSQARHNQSRPAKPTTVTLLIDGMT